MTPEAQRIAIAEACGWKDCKLQANPLNGEINWFAGIDPIVQCEQSVPDYLSDLNAMHEAEEVLTEEQWDEYCWNLRVIVTRNETIPPRGTRDFEIVHATVPKRTEAFLRTLGKWAE
jgi:hypothetical protein